jgi:hypothetical protein
MKWTGTLNDLFHDMFEMMNNITLYPAHSDAQVAYAANAYLLLIKPPKIYAERHDYLLIANQSLEPLSRISIEM